MANRNSTSLKKLIFFALFVSFSMASYPVIANDDDNLFKSRIFLSDLMLRSTRVCGERDSAAELKARIDLAFRLLSADPMKEFSAAFPKKSQEWQEQGASAFNQGVLTDGISKACDYARKVEEQIAAEVDFGAEDVPDKKYLTLAEALTCLATGKTMAKDELIEQVRSNADEIELSKAAEVLQAAALNGNVKLSGKRNLTGDYQETDPRYFCERRSFNWQSDTISN